MQKITKEIRKQQWTQILRTCGESGQTIRGYCKENGIKETSYYYWQRRLRESCCEELVLRQEAMPVSAATFAEVRVRSEEPRMGTLTVRLDGAEIEIGNDASPDLVEIILRTLKNRC